jgi:hypothetical protein
MSMKCLDTFTDRNRCLKIGVYHDADEQSASGATVNLHIESRSPATTLQTTLAAYLSAEEAERLAKALLAGAAAVRGPKAELECWRCGAENEHFTTPAHPDGGGIICHTCWTRLFGPEPTEPKARLDAAKADAGLLDMPALAEKLVDVPRSGSWT